MPVSVPVALGAAVVAVPLVMVTTVAAIPPVVRRRWGRGVVIARWVSVHRGALGYLVHRRTLVVRGSLVNLWPLVALGVIAGLWLRNTAPNRGTCCTASTGTHHRTVAPAHGLAYRGTRCATKGTTDHRCPLTPALGADCGTGCSTERAANHCALAPTHVLTQHRACSCPYAATQQGADIVGVNRCAQSRQRQCAAGKQRGHVDAAVGMQDRSC